MTDTKFMNPWFDGEPPESDASSGPSATELYFYGQPGGDAPQFQPPPSEPTPSEPPAGPGWQPEQRFDVAFTAPPEPAAPAQPATPWNLPKLDLSFAETAAPEMAPQAAAPQPAAPTMLQGWDTALFQPGAPFEQEALFGQPAAPEPDPVRELQNKTVIMGALMGARIGSPQSAPANFSLAPAPDVQASPALPDWRNPAGTGVPTPQAFSPTPFQKPAPTIPVRPFADQVTSYASPTSLALPAYAGQRNLPVAPEPVRAVPTPWAPAVQTPQVNPGVEPRRPLSPVFNPQPPNSFAPQSQTGAAVGNQRPARGIDFLRPAGFSPSPLPQPVPEAPRQPLAWEMPWLKKPAAFGTPAHTGMPAMTAAQLGLVQPRGAEAAAWGTTPKTQSQPGQDLWRLPKELAAYYDAQMRALREQTGAGMAPDPRAGANTNAGAGWPGLNQTSPQLPLLPPSWRDRPTLTLPSDQVGGAELKSYTPSWGDRFAESVGSLIPGDDWRSRHRRQDIAAGTRAVLDWIPGVGSAVSGNEAYRAFQRGDNVGGAIESVSAVADLFPLLGKPVKAGLKIIKPWRKFGLEVLDRLESKSPSLYNPPPKPQRAFEQDYPNGARHDATGRLTHDTDGKPIDPGARIVGRQVVGGSDVPLSAEEYDAVTKAALGLGPAGASQRELPDKAVGAYFKERVDNDLKKSIAFLKTLPEKDATMVIGHEIGHMLDDKAGEFLFYKGQIPFYSIPQDGVKKQLGRIYNDLNTSPKDFRMAAQERTGVPMQQKFWRTPESMGYSAKEAPLELNAEAIRAYLTDPNYIKTVAPKVAERLRQYINSDEKLRKIIHLNTLVGSALLPYALLPRGEKDGS